MSAATGIIRQHKGKLTGSAAALALMSALILHWEGEKLVASHNSIDPPGIIDVCNGITNRELPWLKAGMKFTHEDCEALRLRLMPKYRDPLKKCIKGYEDMPPARQAALGSASWNLGPETVCRSDAARLLNAGDIEGGCRALGQFITAKKIVLKGLINRRNDSNWGEIAWCMENE